MPVVARLAKGARTPARRIVPRRDCSAAPPSSASCSRARSAGDGIRPSLDGHGDARTRRRHVAVSAFAHRSAKRAALQHLGSDHARDGGGYDATGDSERHGATGDGERLMCCRRAGRRRKPGLRDRRDRQEEESQEQEEAGASRVRCRHHRRRCPARRRPPRATAARNRSRCGRPMRTPSKRRILRCGGRRRRPRGC